MTQASDQVAFLQRIVDGIKDTAEAVHAASANASASEDVRRVCIGALGYLLDLLDIFPDHYAGLGLADDAAVLHLAARQAVGQGADDEGLRRVAREADEVSRLLGDMAEAFDKLVAQLGERSVNGRTAAQILASKDVRAMFDADVKRAIAKLQPSKIEVGFGGPDAVVKDMLRMTRHSLKKAGVLD